MPEFWRNSGYYLLERDALGRLAVTDDFLRAYYLRPEIHPVEDSSEAEQALHASLMKAPRRAVAAADIDAIADEDARHNYRLMLRLRQRLLDAGTVEACYLGLFRGGAIDLPPLFLQQLAHVVLRNVLEARNDPLEARAGEIFFREQKSTVRDGQILLADLETVEMHAAGSAYGGLGRLIVEAQGDIGRAELDVLDTGNAELYWQREGRFDTAISLNVGRATLQALCRVIQAWVAHFFGVQVKVMPLHSIEEERWAWHIGLDGESTAILNDLWSGKEVDTGRMRRVLALFRMDFADPAEMRADIAGRAVYLALSANEDEVVRMKPQNLLVNLPLAARA